MNIKCPKCRSLGLTTDCTDQMGHPRKETHVITDDDGHYELEVVMSFTVPVTPGNSRGPSELATLLREQWMNDDGEFRAILGEAVDNDYDLTVQPLFYAE